MVRERNAEVSVPTCRLAFASSGAEKSSPLSAYLAWLSLSGQISVCEFVCTDLDWSDVFGDVCYCPRFPALWKCM